MLGMSIEKLLSTPEPFTKWLRQKKGVVGTSQDPWECPIAHFISEYSGEAGLVGDKNVALWESREDARNYGYATEVLREIPSWMTRFIEIVDTVPDVAVTQEECIKILGEIDA